ncbi:MAG TPA: hypothetical protein VFA12_05335 [Stellaceae bacterium]|nr:hypothetical protein [Stellaceae bacterium]
MEKGLPEIRIAGRIASRLLGRASTLPIARSWPTARRSQALGAYVILIAVVLCSSDYVYARFFFPPVQPTSAGTTTLINRLAWYKTHAADFDLVFLGDSRTYTGIHPELLDPMLGTSSINLGSFSNWFPTQLPFAQNLLPALAPGTSVVWSVGHQNFVPFTEVQRVYPVGFVNAARYLTWGVPTKGVSDNLLYYNPALYFLSQRSEIRQDFLDLLSHHFPVGSWESASAFAGTTGRDMAQPHPAASLSPEVATLKAQWERNPNVVYVDVLRDQKAITSLTVYFRRGSYYRIEIDPEFFRRRQKECVTQQGKRCYRRIRNEFFGDPPQPNPAYWRLFHEILNTFQRYKIHLIVNEMEEAPFVYGSFEERELYRKFMRDNVEPAVRAHGFDYIRTGAFDQLHDDHYFDFDHLNSRGIEIFTPLLAQRLRPLVRNTGHSRHQP